MSNVLKENLKIIIDNGIFKNIIIQIKNLNIMEVDEKRKKYCNQAGLAQFAGIVNSTPDTVKSQFYKLNKDAEDIQKNLIKFQVLINELRSWILGLPLIDYSVAINNNGTYYYIIKNDEIDPFEDIISKSANRLTKNHLSVQTSVLKRETQTAIQKLQQAKNISYQKIHAQMISFHFSQMMRIIPIYSDYHSQPKMKWAAEVFEKHIQETGEKNISIDFYYIYNWSHLWEITSFWDDYHAAEKPGKDLNNKSLQYATATQGGDFYQTQVKSININKKQTGSVDVVNINNMQDIFSFWMNIITQLGGLENLNSTNINDTQLKQILSVLLSNQTIIQLGEKTLGEIRNLKF